MPAFAPALLAPRSPARCLAPAKILGNKVPGVSFLETHSCREPLGQPPLPSSPPQRSDPSEKLGEEEQGGFSKVQPILSGSPPPHPLQTDPPNPITSSSHVRSAPCTSQKPQREAKRDTVRSPWVTAEPSPCVTAARLGAPRSPPPRPKRDPLDSHLGGGGGGSTAAQHPQGSGTLCWP